MQAIITTYHGPTNTRGSRIIAKCDAGCLTTSWDFGLDIRENHERAAEALCAKLGWKPEHYGAMASGSLPTNVGGYAHILIGRET